MSNIQGTPKLGRGTSYLSQMNSSNVHWWQDETETKFKNSRVWLKSPNNMLTSPIKLFEKKNSKQKKINANLTHTQKPSKIVKNWSIEAWPSYVNGCLCLICVEELLCAHTWGTCRKMNAMENNCVRWKNAWKVACGIFSEKFRSIPVGNDFYPMQSCWQRLSGLYSRDATLFTDIFDI